jgi:hypothetical protein
VASGSSADIRSAHSWSASALKAEIATTATGVGFEPCVDDEIERLGIPKADDKLELLW